MRKYYLIFSIIILCFGCDKDGNDIIKYRLSAALKIEEKTRFVNEYIRYQWELESDSVYFAQCSEKPYAFLQRRYNGIWTSLKDSVEIDFENLVFGGQTDSLVLHDSGSFRVTVPVRFFGEVDTVYSEIFAVSDTTKKSIGICTDKVSYSLNEEMMRITVVNHTDSTIYFTKCDGNTDFYIWKSNGCELWNGYWGNICYRSAPVWYSVPPDSLYLDVFYGIPSLQKGLFKIDYRFHDSLYSISPTISAYSNVFVVE